MSTKRLYGIIPPIVTPFQANEDIDEAVLRREVRHLLDAGVHGVSFGGSTGEGALLTDEELSQGIRIVQSENREKVPVLCGIIRNSTRAAISAAQAGEAAGADALMVTPTYYHGTDSVGNEAFFRALAAETNLPIIIYNVIQTNPITPACMERISQIKGIAGIKQSVGGIHGLTDMIQRCGDKTMVFGAQDDLMHISYVLGAVGAISAILSVFPELCVQQWNAVQKGNLALANGIHYRILPVWRLIEGKAFPGKIKAALKLLGRPVGNARQPILPPPSEQINILMQALTASKLLS